MDAMLGRAARRELAVVLALAMVGIALVLLVAFAPWYEPMMMADTNVTVVSTVPAVVVPPVPAGIAVFVEAR